MPKKLIPVPEELLDRLRRIAESAGIPLAELVDGLLSTAARLLEGRTDVASALAEAAVSAELYRLEVALVPFQSLLEAVERADGGSFKKFKEAMAGFARTVATLVRAKGGEVSPSAMLMALLPGLTVSSLEEGGRGRLVVAYTVGLRGRGLELVEAVARAVVEGLGFKAVRLASEGGVLVVEYVKGGGP